MSIGEKMGKSEEKSKSVNEAARDFLAGLDAQIKEAEAKAKKGIDTSPFDKAVLEQIGDESLKKAIAKLSFAQLYNFLKDCGFKGDKKRLADMLAEKGLRKRVETPEHLKKKCVKCGCVLVHQKFKDVSGWICLSCGMGYSLSKGRLTEKGHLDEEAINYFRKENGWQGQKQARPQG